MKLRVRNPKKTQDKPIKFYTLQKKYRILKIRTITLGILFLASITLNIINNL